MYLHIMQLCLFSVITEYLENVIFRTSAGHSDKPTDCVSLGPSVPCDSTLAKTESQWSPGCPVQALLVI